MVPSLWPKGKKMNNQLTPEYHQFISSALAEQKTETEIISNLVRNFNLTIPNSKNLINLVVGLNGQASKVLVSNNLNNIRTAALMPNIKELKQKKNTVLVQGKEVKIIFTMSTPEVILIENFLSDEECQHLINVAVATLTRSTVAVHGEGTSTTSDYRTSNNAALTKDHDDIIKNIEDRISLLFNWNKNDSDSMQVLRYNVGEQYKPHYDFFADNSSFVKGVGERVATLILYLGEPTAGGTTSFPDLNLHVHCKRGSVLFFSYPTPTPDSKTLHAGEPVIEGTKWIATKWFRSQDKQN